MLNEWPRIEATLLDAAARAALRRRLEQAGGDGAGRGRRSAPKPAPTRRPPPPPGQHASLAELARLRDDPDLGSDLFAFLGLPTSATREMLAARIEKIAEVNRRRRPDRERSLTDDLLAHARKLLLEGDPAAYLAGFDDEFRDRVVDALLAGDVEAARTRAGRGARARRERRGDPRAAGGGRAAGDGRRRGRRRRRRAHRSRSARSASARGAPVCDTCASPGATTCPTCQSALTVRCESCTQLVAADLQRCSNCGALLDDARAPLLARRATLRAETDALAEVDRRPAAERGAQLRALARAHPEWAQAQRRLASLPPVAAAQRPDHDRAQRGARELGGRRGRGRLPRRAPRPAGLAGPRSDIDARVDRRRAEVTRGITWTVRALRGQSASSEPVTATSDAPRSRSPSRRRRA